MNELYWLILFVVLIVIEIVTLGLTTVWFAAGALIAFVAALAGINEGIQWILFFAVSVVLLLITRPLAMKYLNKDRVKTNVEGIIGQSGTVLETIHNIENQGKVNVQGMEWTARALKDDEVIEKDSIVTVVEVRGVKLIVEKMEG